MNPPLRVALFGAGGRMGQAVQTQLASDERFALAATFVRDDDPQRLGDADVAIDFSLPEATAPIAAACARAGCALVCGTTGLDAGAREALAAAARVVPVVYAANMSIGVNLAWQLAQQMASRLDESFDVEIVEAHHRHKRDAPSGTALEFGQRVAAGRGAPLEELAHYGESPRPAPRPRGSIGFASIRAGDIVGEHTVVFAGSGERLELTHRAHSRAAFASGALRAAAWVSGRAPGLYDMADVLA